MSWLTQQHRGLIICGIANLPWDDKCQWQRQQGKNGNQNCNLWKYSYCNASGHLQADCRKRKTTGALLVDRNGKPLMGQSKAVREVESKEEDRLLRHLRQSTSLKNQENLTSIEFWDANCGGFWVAKAGEGVAVISSPNYFVQGGPSSVWINWLGQTTMEIFNCTDSVIDDNWKEFLPRNYQKNQREWYCGRVKHQWDDCEHWTNHITNSLRSLKKRRNIFLTMQS